MTDWKYSSRDVRAKSPSDGAYLFVAFSEFVLYGGLLNERNRGEKSFSVYNILVNSLGGLLSFFCFSPSIASWNCFAVIKT